MGELESREAAATRRQGVVHLHLRSHEDAGRLLAGELSRPRESEGTFILVIAPTSEDALRLAEVRAAQRGETDGHLLTPVTATGRGRRQLATSPAAIVGTPGVFAALLGESRLRLDGVRVVALVWPEEILDRGDAASLDALLNEVPRQADRVAIVGQGGKDVDDLLERAMWRARRIDHAEPAPGQPVPLRFIAVGSQQRVSALRALLDSIDPERAALVTWSDTDADVARGIVRALGAEDDDATLQVVRGTPDSPVPLAVLLSVPSASALAELAARTGEIVAIVDPAQVAPLRVAAGGSAHPVPVGGPLATARGELEALRERIRAVVEAQGHLPWMPTLEPLLTDLDPVEVAAGAMALMHRMRRVPKEDRVQEGAGRAAERPTPEPRMSRLFFGIGERDGVRRGDLVGAITGEAGITGAQVGKIVLRESHAVVEVDATVASQVIRKLGGTAIKGRKLVVRMDREPGDASRPGGDRKPGPRGRGAPKTGRGTSRREDREPRARRDRDEIERVPRAAREDREWAERGDRLRHSRRRPGSEG